MKEEHDMILTELREAVGPVLDKIEREVDSERAAFVIGAKEMKVKGEYAGIQTFVDICGDYGIIGEAIYTELKEGIENKKPELFNMLREVIKAIEEELELTDEQPIPTPTIIH